MSNASNTYGSSQTPPGRAHPHSTMSSSSGSELAGDEDTDPSSLWQRCKSAVYNSTYSVVHSATASRPSTVKPGLPVFIMGTFHDSRTTEGMRELQWALSRLTLFSYRKGFSSITRDGALTYDTGWGCVLRTGQMMLYQALTRAFPRDSMRMIDLFRDEPSAPFSIHQICLCGNDTYGVKCGEWFSPTVMCYVLQDLVEQYFAGRFNVYVVRDSCVSLPMLAQYSTPQPPPLDEELCDNNGKDETNGRPTATSSSYPTTTVHHGASPRVLVLIPMMLGMNEIGATYHDSVLRCFEVRQSVGIVGGRPRKSLYFYGHQGREVLYLDPHTRVQEAFVSGPTMGVVHEKRSAVVNIAQLDPSMFVGFLIRDAEDLDHWTRTAKELVACKWPMFCLSDKPEQYGSPHRRNSPTTTTTKSSTAMSGLRRTFTEDGFELV